MRKIYTALLYLASPFIFLYLFFKTRKTRDYEKRWSELLGYAPSPIKSNGIWLHAVSLGELTAALPLIKAIKNEYPNDPLVVTTMTKSAAQRLQKEFNDTVTHIYVPLDFPSAARRFLQSTKPKLAIFMETELWPNRINACAEMKIPLFLANARISPNTFNSYARLTSLVTPMLQNFTRVIAQSESDAKRFQQLGMPASRITVAGNIKFDIEVPATIQAKAQDLRQHWKTRPVWIAASTHEGEESIVLDAFKKIKQKIPSILLILVPRHSDRFTTVKNYCTEQGYNVALRTVGETDYSKTDIFIGNTTGELLLFYACSDIALVGGSLIPVGGHNLLEPASLGLPILVGPHVFNCRDIHQLLNDAKALINIDSSEQMATEIIRLFENKALMLDMGQNAKRVVEENRGALARHMEIIKRS